MPLLWRVKASSSSSFSLSVLGDYKRSGGSRVFRHRVIMFGLRSHPSITKVRLRYYEVFGDLFSGGSLSLKADSWGRPKLPGSDSRLNLAHLSAASSRST
ncbi:hypothetical protein Bca52824_087951 [Brassica carinata]|uniref:Uncharacterized protein n=1 Tax=Brassica carinata TaxID=52824 RepID=A0A8X7PCH7_BRACI|nr:hypothetical protein Bca52824_087951 [Brassica carinata]